MVDERGGREGNFRSQTINVVFYFRLNIAIALIWGSRSRGWWGRRNVWE